MWLPHLAEMISRSSSWPDLLEGLLHRCADRAAAFHALLEADEPFVSEVVEALDAEVEALLGSVVSSRPHASQLEALSRIADQHLDRFGEAPGEDAKAVVARGTAIGLGRSMPDTMHEWYAARGELVLEPGKLHPVHSYDPTPYLQGPANTNPQSLPTASLRAVPHFRLGDDETASYRVVLDWDARNRLAPLTARRPMKIAAAQVNTSQDELEVEWVSVPDGWKAVRVQGPRDPDAQVATVRTVLRLAAAEQVDVLLLPEYALGVDSRQEVVDELTDLAWRPTLVVGGSARVVVTDAAARNQGVLWMPQGAPLTLTKAHQARICEHAEDVSTAGAEFRVLISGDWAVCTLICADALSTTLLRLLEDVGVNLLLVIAMSEKTTSMVGNWSGLVVGAQAFAALANGPALWDPPVDGRATAAFQGPYATGPAPTLVFEGEIEAPVPGLVVYDTAARTWRFLGASRDRH